MQISCSDVHGVFTVRSIEAQISEVEREIAMRKDVYPRLVQRRKMREGEAAEHLLLMECVHATLQRLLKHRDVINKAIAEAT